MHMFCCTGENDFVLQRPPFIVSQFVFETLFNTSVDQFNDARELLLNSSMSPEEFFQNFPILDNFFYCGLLENIDDNVIEDTEEFTLHFEPEIGIDGPLYAAVTVVDNDGKYILLRLSKTSDRFISVVTFSLQVLACHFQVVLSSLKTTLVQQCV